jgi:hypothetical protein
MLGYGATSEHQMWRFIANEDAIQIGTSFYLQLAVRYYNHLFHFCVFTQLQSLHTNNPF